MILFTINSVTEAMNLQNEEFGEERLNKLLLENRELNAKALQECIVKAVADFTGGAFQDDVTMIVVSAGINT